MVAEKIFQMQPKGNTIVFLCKVYTATESYIFILINKLFTTFTKDIQNPSEFHFADGWEGDNKVQVDRQTDMKGG